MMDYSHWSEQEWSLLQGLTPVQREYFEERAAIAEFDGGLSRADAERSALLQTCLKYLKQYPAV